MLPAPASVKPNVPSPPTVDLSTLIVPGAATLTNVQVMLSPGSTTIVAVDEATSVDELVSTQLIEASAQPAVDASVTAYVPGRRSANDLVFGSVASASSSSENAPIDVEVV